MNRRSARIAARLSTPYQVRGCARAAVIASAAGLAWTGLIPAFAQPIAKTPTAATDGPVTSIDVARINGRDFAGMRLPLATQDGPIDLAARKVYVFGDSIPGATRRLLLVGDVRVGVGPFDLQAARACVWIEPLEDGVFQVAINFDRVGTASDPVGTSNAIRVAGDRLLVRGVLRPPQSEGVKLKADLVVRERPTGADGAFVTESEGELARSLRRLVPGFVEEIPDPLAGLPKGPDLVPTPPAYVREGVEAGMATSVSEAARAPGIPGTGRPFEPSRRTAADESVRSIFADTAIGEISEPIFARNGIISLGFGSLSLVPGGSGEEERTVVATGGVTVQYTDVREDRRLEMTAQRAVVFLKGGRVGPFDATRMKQGDVEAIYLEGDVVASDGKYTLRGPQMMYDVARNKAVVLDGVFWTYDERRGLPLYVRAKTIRQEAADEFKATGAVFANSAFFEPEFSIGATSVTISRRATRGSSTPGDAGSESDTAAAGDGRVRTTIDARNITLRAAGFPVFYWPRFTGDPAAVPLKDLRFENSRNSGFAVKTRLNVFGLLGMDQPDWFTADALVDYYGERGVGLGTRLGWNRETSAGGLYVYGLPGDSGTDAFRTGLERAPDDNGRLIALGEHRWRLDEHWSAMVEGAYVGDASFVGAFFPELAAERREFISRARVQRRSDQSLFSLEVSGNVNDFVANDYLLESQGYSVQKLPEATYTRLADDVFDDFAPGVVTYWSEYRAGQVSLSFDDEALSTRGLNNTGAQRLFGLDADQRIADQLRSIGLDEEAVTRLDTRHEISSQFREGPVSIQPFLIGRASFYDNGFTEYNQLSGFGTGRENDETRMWGAYGVRIGTTIQRVHDDVDSRFFDVHRLRHIVEPSVTAMYSGTNVPSTSLPVFDDSVESLLTGGIVRAGVTQRFQTQRGGPGRWHSVDLFTLSTDVVLSTSDAKREGRVTDGPITRFYEARPELSTAGDAFIADAVWQTSDTLAITGGGVFDFDIDQLAVSTAGVLLRHNPSFSTYADVRFINSQDATLVTAGSRYEFASKYSLSLSGSYDASNTGFQGASIQLIRRFESMVLGANIGYDEVSGDTSFGILFQPYGARGSAAFGSSGRTTIGGWE